MSEIERIIELVASNRLDRESAKKLLAALHPQIGKLPEGVIEHLFTQVSERQLSVTAVAALLEPGAVPTPPVAPPPLPVGNRKTARMLNIQIEGADGSDVRLNLPLGLANFALKMIPKHAQVAINEQGLDLGLLQQMLQNELPEGDLVSINSSDGSEIRIWIE